MSDTLEPSVILVDEQDQVIGQEYKQKAHELGLCHRAFSVFILRNHNNTTQVLMQKRAANKYHCGGLWTNTCCSHPAPHQTTKAAAQERLRMEMGIQASLQYAGVFHYIAHFENDLTENEVDHVYYGWLDDHATITPNRDEVDEHRWMNITDLNHTLSQPQPGFTPWLQQALTLVEQQLKERSHCGD